ncbi:MAG TPA: hypothetical protein VKB12_12415 [Pyrinomonadaceae bacterium]|nr:hypothetical protein [Pyrinomonadaceae bacterium]
MKTLTLTAALTLVLHSIACGGVQRTGAPPAPSPTPETVILSESGLTPESAAVLKNQLFADEPIEKLLGHTELGSAGANEEPWRSFALHVTHSKEGKVEEAKKDLRRVLALPAAEETRVRLQAWAGLRALGERPPRAVADEVLGVVCELHNEAGVGTLAAYEDGRARWYGGRRSGILWEAPGDKEVDSSIAELLKSVGPLVKRAPAVETREPTDIKMEHFRVSILTPGGIHVIDVYGPDIDGEARYLAPTLMASVSLLDTLNEKQSQKGQ